MRKGTIRIATCQFKVTGDPRHNSRIIQRQLLTVARKKARVIHFSECALSGYGGSNVKTWKGYPWDILKEETRAICRLAAAKKVWVVLGSSHPLSGRNRPHNCLYVIDDRGRVRDRYDKRFCTPGDLNFYSPGDHFTTFTVDGIKCGCLICYDTRFPELYRAYKKRGVQVMFHSFHNAGSDGPIILTDIMPATVKTRAATNSLWVSANNSSRHYQAWSSILVQPDGIVVARLRQHTAGVMVNTVDTKKIFYDAAGPNRKRAVAGRLNSGRLVKDPRSRDRTRL